MKLQDHYETLGVARGSRPEAIKQAYRLLVLRWHPDRHSGSAREKAAERFKEISEAYEVLSDPDRRREHDVVVGRSTAGFARGKTSARRDMHEEESGSGMSDAFSTMYGGFEKGFADVNTRGTFQSRGRDIEADCPLTVTQLMAGGSVDFDVPVRAECGECLGEGFIEDTSRNETICAGCEGNGTVAEAKPVVLEVPAAAYDGAEIRLEGKGVVGAFGGEPGDICVTLRVQSDETYRVVGKDIHADLPVAPWEALDGTRVEVMAPTGVLRVSVPPETKNGARLRVTGNGLLQEGGDRGDLYLAVRYDLPLDLTVRQQELIRELGKAGENAVSGGARS